MLNKIVSFALSLIMSFFGLGAEASAEGLKAVFNNAYSLVSERSDFLAEISQSDFSLFSENSGYVKNMALIFFEDDASFFERIDALRSIDGVAVGSLPEANLCVISTLDKNLEQLNTLCEKAQEHEAVAIASICPVGKYEEQYTPNDPFQDTFIPNIWDESNPDGYNWWLEAIEARSAWGYSSYFNHINIGVIDSGFDLDNGDLQGKIVFPSAMTESRNEIKSHGTHVAGILAAKGDNGKGICGIVQNATLICQNWDNSWLTSVAIFFCFGTAVKAGSKVINMSLGSSGALNPDEWYWMNWLNDMEGMLYSYYMGSLIKSGYDFVVVQAAGNGNGGGEPIDSGQNGCFCCVNEGTAIAPIGLDKQEILDRIIIVGSCYYEKGKYIQADSSNVGKGVDISAPGVNILSAYATKDDTQSYATMSGTSMACPVVAGVAALVWSVNPNFSGSEVKKIVCENTKHTAEPYEYYKFEEYLDLMNYPVVNAKMAVEAALKQSFEMLSVEVETSPRAQVEFKNNETGDEFVFEADSLGKLTCLLEKGNYQITVNSVVLSAEQSIEADSYLICGEAV